MSQEGFERGVFEGKVLSQLDNIGLTLNEIKANHDSLSARLHKIEYEYGKVKGFTLAIGAIAGAVGSYLVKLLPLLTQNTK